MISTTKKHYFLTSFAAKKVGWDYQFSKKSLKYKQKNTTLYVTYKILPAQEGETLGPRGFKLTAMRRYLQRLLQEV